MDIPEAKIKPGTSGAGPFADVSFQVLFLKTAGKPSTALVAWSGEIGQMFDRLSFRAFLLRPNFKLSYRSGL